MVQETDESKRRWWLEEKGVVALLQYVISETDAVMKQRGDAPPALFIARIRQDDEGAPGSPVVDRLSAEMFFSADSEVSAARIEVLRRFLREKQAVALAHVGVFWMVQSRCDDGLAVGFCREEKDCADMPSTGIDEERRRVLMITIEHKILGERVWIAEPDGDVSAGLYGGSMYELEGLTGLLGPLTGHLQMFN